MKAAWLDRISLSADLNAVVGRAMKLYFNILPYSSPSETSSLKGVLASKRRIDEVMEDRDFHVSRRLHVDEDDDVLAAKMWDRKANGSITNHRKMR